MTKEGEDIFHQTVSEGDIDWIFCVELNASESFRDWVGSIVFPQLPDFEHIRAWRSVSNTLGESDLIWLVEHAKNGRHMALIENKINAVSQPEQFQRYIQRGENYVDEGLAQSYSVVLLSPESYRSMNSSSYPINISYEAIIEYLSTKNGERSNYLSSLYDAAINKRQSSSPIDEEMSQFREKVWCLANEEFPALNVPKPESVGGGEYWIFMRHEGYTLIHKTYRKGWKYTQSVIDLELAGRGDDVDTLKKEYGKSLEGTGICVVKTNKSASFRLEVPQIDPPKFEEEKMRKALSTAQLLKNWWDNQ
ncbi:MAG: PD-(D/E)XK nuclease family protein [Proteobacteria bacterium]|nr:PD-(D/E)XK nuclease family protein [Pseudomonadota bacterium]